MKLFTLVSALLLSLVAEAAPTAEEPERFMLSAVSVFNETLNDTLLTSFWQSQGIEFTYFADLVWPIIFTLNGSVLAVSDSQTGGVEQAAQLYKYSDEFTVLAIGYQPPDGSDEWQKGYGFFHDLLTFHHNFWNWYACFNIGTTPSESSPVVAYFDNFHDVDWSKCTPVFIKKFPMQTPQP
ncbi:hypothetical protein TRICI_003426 [Trichomonascus ciferrii]|uniref:Uncharacterized protein n=1 Tax=Trichomonascus ciferrii TaxID=44093 RepID=A0A642V3U3_9ASCO|nr:hypothetical protein TRICI_003426 [Trichomonascus ciferrii]